MRYLSYFKLMCGGVGFKISDIRKQELERYYKPDEVDVFLKDGKAQSFYWHKDPVLPVKTKDGVHLLRWGNKEENLKLPMTGWAKKESLEAHKWDYLHPEVVDIPVEEGYEKKVWFDLKGTKGIVVKKGEEERVYMITKEASEEYEKQTHHNREPLGEKGNYRK